MKPDVPMTTCPLCKAPATLEQRATRYRRGDRVLAVDTWAWQCSSECADPATGESPYRFLDPPLLRWNDDFAKEAWLEQFGDPMPESRRGRRRGEKRTVRVPVMLTPSEAKRLDRLRGAATRSEFLRKQLSGKERKTG